MGEAACVKNWFGLERICIVRVVENWSVGNGEVKFLPRVNRHADFISDCRGGSESTEGGNAPGGVGIEDGCGNYE